jgi:hypothetical protein
MGRTEDRMQDWIPPLVVGNSLSAVKITVDHLDGSHIDPADR